MLSASQPSSPFVSLSHLMRASRLIAGYGDIDLVSERLDLDLYDENYADFETWAFPQISTGNQIARLFGVSRGFLFEGKAPITGREHFAAVLARAFATLESTKPTFVKFAQSLITVREAAGYATPAEAAAAKGWNSLLYTAHEQQARTLDANQLAIYALGFGFHPGPAILGHTPMEIWGDAVPWWKEQKREGLTPSAALSGVAFDWLADRNCASPVMNLPVVEFVKNKWTLLDTPFPLPRLFLPAAEAAAGDTLFAVADRYNELMSLVVVDPTLQPDGFGVTLDTAGRIGIRTEAGGKVVDPLHYRPKRKRETFLVGRYLTTTMIGRARPPEK